MLSHQHIAWCHSFCILRHWLFDECQVLTSTKLIGLVWCHCIQSLGDLFCRSFAWLQQRLPCRRWWASECPPSIGDVCCAYLVDIPINQRILWGPMWVAKCDDSGPKHICSTQLWWQLERICERNGNRVARDWKWEGRSYFSSHQGLEADYVAVKYNANTWVQGSTVQIFIPRSLVHSQPFFNIGLALLLSLPTKHLLKNPFLPYDSLDSSDGVHNSCWGLKLQYLRVTFYSRSQKASGRTLSEELLPALTSSNSKKRLSSWWCYTLIRSGVKTFARAWNRFTKWDFRMESWKAVWQQYM